MSVSESHWPDTLCLLLEEALPIKECFHPEDSNSKLLVTESTRSPRVNLVDGHPSKENAKSSAGNATHKIPEHSSAWLNRIEHNMFGTKDLLPNSLCQP